MPSDDMDFSKITIKKLKPSDNFMDFNCDYEDDLGCNDFIHKEEEAKLFQKERLGITYLFFHGKMMVGYVTIAMSSIPAKKMDRRYKEPIRLRFYPSLLIGRLAVDNNYRQKGVGRYLCEWCIGLAVNFSEDIGCRYVILQTTEKKIHFYSKCRFRKAIVLEDEKGPLFWMYQRTAI